MSSSLKIICHIFTENGRSLLSLKKKVKGSGRQMLTVQLMRKDKDLSFQRNNTLQEKLSVEDTLRKIVNKGASSGIIEQPRASE